MSSTRTLPARAALILGLGALALTACGTPRGGDDIAAVNPTSQFPLQTTTAPSGVQLSPHDFGLSPNQAQALRDLADDWRASGDGLILIEAPVCACEDGAVTAYDARAALISFGVPETAIRMIGYEAEPSAPIRVSFQKMQARTWDCDREWDDLTRSGANRPRSNFGCSVNSNLAAMIENPADIERPRAMDPYDAGRRQVVIERYRQGQPTGAERDDNADATISDALN